MTTLVSIDLEKGVLKRYVSSCKPMLTNIAVMKPWETKPKRERVIEPEDVEAFRVNPPKPEPMVA